MKHAFWPPWRLPLRRAGGRQSRRCAVRPDHIRNPARRQRDREVSRVPDIAIISAGVMTRSASATGAISENAARMERVRAALKRAGIADRDIQTSNISLNPEYRYQENQPPQLTGYTASNQVSVRFRDIRNTGRILDALVAEGANQINGPSLTIDKPEAALDEPSKRSPRPGQGRALCARLGMRGSMRRDDGGGIRSHRRAMIAPSAAAWRRHKIVPESALQ